MTLARNTVAYWTAQFGNYVLAFATSVFTTVHLGPDHRGLLVAVILANTLTVNLTNLGMQTFAMYFMGKSPEKLARIHTLLIWIVGAISLTDFALIGIAAVFRADILSRVPALRDLEWPYFVAALGVLPFSLYYFAAQGVLAGLGRVPALSRFLFHYGAATSALNLAAVICFPLDRPKLAHALILLWIVGQAAAAIGTFLIIRRSGRVWENINWSEGRGEVVQMLSYGLRAFVGNFASALVNRTDHLFILSAFGTAGIGVYNLSAKLAELVFQPSAAFENAAYARTVSGDRLEVGRLVQDLFRTNFLLNLLLVVGLAALARPLVLFVFHEEFAEAIRPLVILLPGTLFFGCSRMLAMYFSAQLGRPQIPSAIAWATTGVNIALLWWVIVRMKLGLAASAAATSASYLFMLVCYLVLFARATGRFNPADYVLPKRRDWDRLRNLLKRE